MHDAGKELSRSAQIWQESEREKGRSECWWLAFNPMRTTHSITIMLNEHDNTTSSPPSTISLTSFIVISSASPSLMRTVCASFGWCFGHCFFFFFRVPTQQTKQTKHKQNKTKQNTNKTQNKHKQNTKQKQNNTNKTKQNTNKQQTKQNTNKTKQHKQNKQHKYKNKNKHKHKTKHKQNTNKHKQIQTMSKSTKYKSRPSTTSSSFNAPPTAIPLTNNHNNNNHSFNNNSSFMLPPATAIPPISTMEPTPAVFLSPNPLPSTQMPPTLYSHPHIPYPALSHATASPGLSSIEYECELNMKMNCFPNSFSIILFISFIQPNQLLRSPMQFDAKRLNSSNRSKKVLFSLLSPAY